MADTLVTKQTKVKARLYTKTARPTDMYVPALYILVCNWVWDSGDLKGKRRIESADDPEYIGYFVNDADLQEPVVMPPSGGDWPAYFFLEAPDGTRQKYYLDDGTAFFEHHLPDL